MRSVCLLFFPAPHPVSDTDCPHYTFAERMNDFKADLGPWIRKRVSRYKNGLGNLAKNT